MFRGVKLTAPDRVTRPIPSSNRMPPDVTAPEMQAPAVAHPTTAPSDPHAPHEPDRIETIIEPSRGWIGVNWREMFRGRELLYFLIWRDIKVRYKQAVLGAGWAILQPVLSMIIFTLVFGVGLSFETRPAAHVPYTDLRLLRAAAVAVLRHGPEHGRHVAAGPAEHPHQDLLPAPVRPDGGRRRRAVRHGDLVRRSLPS